MSVVLRSGTLADAESCGQVCFEAFRSIDDEHNFPWDFPSAEVATGLMMMLLSNAAFYSVIAENKGDIVGSNFLDERGPIAGVGPNTVDPAWQNRTTGRQLMSAVLDRARTRNAAGVRLLQSAFHNRSLCLYAKLGFETRETVSKMNGPPLGLKFPGYHVRLGRESDLAACNSLCIQVHGHHRSGEVSDAIRAGTARVVEHLGKITGYTTEVAFFGHAVAETNQGLKALIGEASGFAGGGFLVPTRNGELFRWCLQNGLRLAHQMTLMTVGLYNEPTGAYMPSVHY
jgi:predicted N-acetyltransferase YhbS